MSINLNKQLVMKDRLCKLSEDLHGQLKIVKAVIMQETASF